MLNMKRIIALILAAGISTAVLAGCDKTHSKDKDETTTTVTQKADLPPGKDIPAQVGAEEVYQDVAFTVDKIYEPRKGIDKTQFIVLDMTIKNNGSSDYDINAYKNFDFYVDGKVYKDPITAKAVQAAIQQQNGMEIVNGKIKAGETLKAMLPLQLDNGWQKVEVKYLPYSATSNDALVYSFTPADVAAVQ